ncbi:MAG: 6-phosphogluconolactonase [Thermodesulfobacteriota bacterium]
MTPEVRRFPTLAAACRSLAEYLTAIATADAAANNVFSLVLTGGSTARSLYRELAAPAAIDGMPWPCTHLFWSDERLVPPTDPASNYGMAKALLLDHVPVPSENIHAVATETASAEVSAARYEEELRRYFGNAGGGPPDFPRFDCVLLGMGEDGHVASLFPGSPLLHEKRRWVAACGPAGSPFLPRITLTLPVLNHARRVVLLIGGERKAAVLDDILAASAETASPYPAARIRTPATRIWFVAP